MEESEILDNSFNLIFAFDEIVALGYRNRFINIRLGIILYSYSLVVKENLHYILICF